ncbi:hypothetical protein ACICHK_01615 [Streptomyces sp. AHU1]|uniref:hypothetical protein n=1 Tax=Streptomyces sp. AHU1 TaxID=3377215 RepID=UPI003877AD49
MTRQTDVPAGAAPAQERLKVHVRQQRPGAVPASPAQAGPRAPMRSRGWGRSASASSTAGNLVGDLVGADDEDDIGPRAVWIGGDIPLAIQLTWRVDGVVGVVNSLTFRIDDTRPPEQHDSDSVTRP